MQEFEVKLRLEAARYVLGMPFAGLGVLALAALDAGWDCPALRTLAGLDDADEAELRSMFEDLLGELDVAAPAPGEAIKLLAKDIAVDIVEGRRSPQEGAESLWDLANFIPPPPRYLHPFIYAASEMRDRPRDRAMFKKEIMRSARDLLEDSSSGPT